MSSTEHDLHWMTRALALAQESIGVSDPNPRVGCVLVAQDGQLLAEGSTREAGGPHAEAVALRALEQSGRSAVGSTAYVTLEPCSHHGRTPPCAEALVRAGVARAVVAVEDPNPLVAGRGIELLRHSGIRVDTGVLADEARELNIGFFSRMTRGRPWVRMKVAASLDGRTALPGGQSQWITGEEARIDGHRWRKRAGAVLTGVGTVLADDPRLDVRHVQTVRQPDRIVVDSKLRTPPNARLLRAPGRPTIAVARPDLNVAGLFQAAGVEILALPTPQGCVDLPALIDELAARGTNELHLECGATLNGAFLSAGLVDEMVLYLGPVLLGCGRPLANLPTLKSLDQAARWVVVSTAVLGQDVRVVVRRPLA